MSSNLMLLSFSDNPVVSSKKSGILHACNKNLNCSSSDYLNALIIFGEQAMHILKASPSIGYVLYSVKSPQI